MGKSLVVCDFDGTVNRMDVGSNLLKGLVPEKWDRINEEYNAGRLTNIEIYKKILGPALKNIGSDPVKIARRFLVSAAGFAGFYRFCGRAGHRLIILSDGFDIYIREFLSKYALDIEFYANKMVKNGDGYVLEFPHHDNDCSICGTCKTRLLRNLKKFYSEIIYVGDGDSDICPSRHSTVFFGKKKVLKKMRNKSAERSVPHLYFYDFNRLEELLLKRGGYRAVIFDLDGTVVDGFDIIYESFNYSLAMLGLKTVPVRRIRNVIGPALSEGFRRLVPQNLVEDGVRLYRSYYKERYLHRNMVLEDMRELLFYLKERGVIVGMITNKKVSFASELLEYLNLAGHFDFIRGAEEGYLPKPEGELMNVIAKRHNLKKTEIIYVGDSVIDGSFAQNSGVDFIAVGMGLGKEDELYRHRPLAYCETGRELRRVLEFLI